MDGRADNGFDVLVIGRACVDFISVVERFPAEDSKVPLEERLVEGGGQGATASCCIARLGGRVCYKGRVGDDEPGRLCMKLLEDSGVPTGHMEVVEGSSTPIAYVFVTKETACRTIIYERSHLPLIETTEEMMSLLGNSRAVLIDPQATHLASRLASFKKLPAIVYDCERWRDGIEDMMRLADYFIPSAEFLSPPDGHVEGETLMEKVRSLARMVSGTLVVTDGERGAYYVDGDLIRQVLPPAAEVRDTTGAGDNFHAAFALAVSRGFGLRDAVRFSVAVATLSCRAYGGRKGIPGFEEALRVMQSLEEKVVAKV